MPLLLFELTLHAAMESPNQVLMAVMILTGLYLPGEPWFAEGGDSCPFLCGNLWALLESLYLPVSMIFRKLPRICVLTWKVLVALLRADLSTGQAIGYVPGSSWVVGTG